MIIKKHKTIQEEYVHSVVCNQCGCEMKTESSPNGNGVHIKYEGGYDSSYFGDGSSVEFDICEGCLHKMIKSFAVDPESDERYSNHEDAKDNTYDENFDDNFWECVRFCEKYPFVVDIIMKSIADGKRITCKKPGICDKFPCACMACGD